MRYKFNEIERKYLDLLEKVEEYGESAIDDNVGYALNSIIELSGGRKNDYFAVVRFFNVLDRLLQAEDL